MKTLTEDELKSLERDGATVRWTDNVRRLPEPQKQENPLAGIATVLQQLGRGVEVASKATEVEARLSRVEADVQYLRDDASLTPKFSQSPDREEVRQMIAESVPESMPLPAPFSGKVKIVRRGKLIDYLTVDGRKIVFNRGSDLSLESIEFKEK